MKNLASRSFKLSIAALAVLIATPTVGSQPPPKKKDACTPNFYYTQIGLRGRQNATIDDFWKVVEPKYGTICALERKAPKTGSVHCMWAWTGSVPSAANDVVQTAYSAMQELNKATPGTSELEFTGLISRITCDKEGNEACTVIPCSGGLKMSVPNCYACK